MPAHLECCVPQTREKRDTAFVLADRIGRAKAPSPWPERFSEAALERGVYTASGHLCQDRLPVFERTI